jgi:hypothetical protein
MYMPHPFQITQSTNKIHFAYAFSNRRARFIWTRLKVRPTIPGWAIPVGRWEGTRWSSMSRTSTIGPGSTAPAIPQRCAQLVERFTLSRPTFIWYDVTIEDPNVFTRPWRIAMPIYRRAEPNMQLLEFRCNEFAEEFMYGHLRKQPLVKRWEGETMTSTSPARSRPAMRSISGTAGKGEERLRPSRPQWRLAWTEMQSKEAIDAHNACHGAGSRVLRSGMGASASAHHAFAAEFDAKTSR